MNKIENIRLLNNFFSSDNFKSYETNSSIKLLFWLHCEFNIFFTMRHFFNFIKSLSSRKDAVNIFVESMN